MAKKVLVGMFFLCIALPALTALPLDWSSSSTWGMAQAGISLDYESDSFLANPALLDLEREKRTTFLISSQYRDTPSWTLEQPVGDLSVSFVSGKMAFSIQSRSLLDDRQAESGGYRYVGTRKTLFQFDWATGKSPFSFGVTARAVAGSQRNPLRIRDSIVLLDYFVETVVGRYDASDSESSISFGVGLLLDYQWLRMSVVSNEVAFGNFRDSLAINANTLLKSLDWGISLSSPTYDENNQLHLFKVESALDFVNIGSSTDRQLRIGFSVKLQLLPTWSVSLQTGYQEMKDTPSDLLRLDLRQGWQTVGLDARLETVRLNLSYGWPTAGYVGASATKKPILLVGASLLL